MTDKTVRWTVKYQRENWGGPSSKNFSSEREASEFLEKLKENADGGNYLSGWTKEVRHLEPLVLLEMTKETRERTVLLPLRARPEVSNSIKDQI